MTITAAQIRGARALLRWNSLKLAKRSKVGFATILKAQLDAEIGSVSGTDLWAIRAALEAAGIEFTVTSRASNATGVIFIVENGEGPGVRLWKFEQKDAE